MENSLKTFDLCSESTGKAKFAVVSVGTTGEATEAMKVLFPSSYSMHGASWRTLNISHFALTINVLYLEN